MSVEPLTADEAFGMVPFCSKCKNKLRAIASKDHIVIDTSTHAAISKTDLAQLRELLATRDKESADARAEIALDDKIIAERDRVLEAIPECPAHGSQCIPHAVQWVKDAIARQEGQP